MGGLGALLGDSNKLSHVVTLSNPPKPKLRPLFGGDQGRLSTATRVLEAPGGLMVLGGAKAPALRPALAQRAQHLKHVALSDPKPGSHPKPAVELPESENVGLQRVKNSGTSYLDS